MGFLSVSMQLDRHFFFYRFYNLTAGRKVTGVEMAIHFYYLTGVFMRSLFLATMFISVSAVACPDLSGSYPVCRTNSADSKPDQNMVMTQEVVNGVTVYTSTSTDSETNETITDTLAADGKEIEATSPDGLPITLKYTASCADEALVLDLAASIGEERIGTVQSKITKEGNALVTRTTGNILGEDVTEETICE
jgi:hypothetical protein